MPSLFPAFLRRLGQPRSKSGIFKSVSKSFLLLTVLASGAKAQDPFIGEIRIFAGNFSPRGWAFCAGQLLPISQNTALFSILGTTYGGDGKTTFALPDLRGRMPVGMGKGPGLTERALGEAGGQESVTLTEAQIPAHTHAITVAADSTVATTDRPQGALPARNAAAIPAFGKTSNSTLAPNAATAAPAGGGAPHPNMPPFLGIGYIIALQGIFPARD